MGKKIATHIRTHVPMQAYYGENGRIISTGAVPAGDYPLFIVGGRIIGPDHPEYQKLLKGTWRDRLRDAAYDAAMWAIDKLRG